ncbi:TetR/AcrR family transcriptional regulator [Terrimonas rubra]|uniref:TetR/AcrR family transcriptional regulator n=1 Tax=Terrimonas rubra TaxID=1035890 RepID=A0ABW6A6X5_9BACT
MQKKVTKPRERNKDKSKQQLLDAVGRLLRTKGYTALKVNDIAARAGLDKKLIYKYFGGTDQLVDAYIRSQDFWSNIGSDDIPASIPDGGLALSRQMLTQQFDYVAQHKELQKILLWGLAEKRRSLKKLADDREASGEVLFSHITDPFFKEDATRYRAVMAILISGIYYLNMYTNINGQTFCGINLTSTEGKREIKDALENLMDLVYADRQNKIL